MADERPAVWIGHEVLAARDVGRSADFWRALGMREIERNSHVAIMELRGGTHLVIVHGTPERAADAMFDLMVEDLDATHAKWKALGLEPSEIEHGDIHSQFTVVDPDGHRVTVNSSHVVGRV
jgi:catechol 2,3-dioxygenase-like lactoylglutathione lyase family enzyme